MWLSVPSWINQVQENLCDCMALFRGLQQGLHRNTNIVHMSHLFWMLWRWDYRNYCTVLKAWAIGKCEEARKSIKAADEEQFRHFLFITRRKMTLKDGQQIIHQALAFALCATWRDSARKKPTRELSQKVSIILIAKFHNFLLCKELWLNECRTIWDLP